MLFRKPRCGMWIRLSAGPEYCGRQVGEAVTHGKQPSTNDICFRVDDDSSFFFVLPQQHLFITVCNLQGSEESSLSVGGSPIKNCSCSLVQAASSS